MNSHLCLRTAVSFLLICLLCAVPAVAIEAVLGDVVTLEGYSTGSMYVYLFLTGPNLPTNGVQLDAVTKRADQGYFTRLTVDSNDHWSYKWDTGNVGGRIDEGTYTVWVVNGPNDRSNLANADYRTLSVTLGQPSLTAAVSGQQQYGAIEVLSTPSGASVSLDGQYRGRTPLTIPDVTPGTHTLTFSLAGYYEFPTPVLVQEGMTSEVSATLEPVPVTTTTTVMTTTIPPTTAPVPTTKAAAVLPAVIPACLALLLLCRGRKL